MKFVNLVAFTAAAAALSSVSEAQEKPPRNESRIIVAGQRTQFYAWYSLNPDCSPKEPVTLRVLKQPANGVFEHMPGQGFPSSAADSKLQKCSLDRRDGTLFFYTPKAGFVGTDQLEAEVINSTGQSVKLRFRLTVK
jgi:hypothetical protein